MNFGIDFGTSNSGVVFESGSAREPIGEGREPYPSIAAIEIVTDRIASGRRVREHQAEFTASGLYRVVTSVKQHLDTPRDWPSHGRRWTPEDVAAEILRTLKDRVRERTGADMNQATISIPVGFTSGKRAALRRAARKAGIDVRAFISEPTAALLGQVERFQHCRYAAVFDWGGGTLDISVLEIYGQMIRELNTASLTEAGDDIDRDIASAIHKAIMDARRETRAFDSVAPRDRDLLLTHCERIKRDLADPRLNDAPISMLSYDGRPFEYRLTRQDFDILVQHRVDRAIHLLRQTIEEVPLSVQEIDELIVTGGSSRLLLLRERLAKDFDTARFSPQPEWDIANGAAALDRLPGSYVLAESIGVVLSDGVFHPLLRSGDKPEGATSTVSLALVEDSPQAQIPIARLNAGGAPTSLLTLNVPALGFDRERIDLSCAIDSDLVLNCKAQSLARGGGAATATDGKVRFVYQVGIDGATV